MQEAMMDFQECVTRYKDLKKRDFLPMKDELDNAELTSNMLDFQKLKHNKVHIRSMASRLHYYKCIGQNSETWTSTAEADLALNESKEKLEEEQKLVNEEKEQIEQLIDKTVNDYEALLKNIQIIEEKLPLLEEKKSKLESFKAKETEVLRSLGEEISSSAKFYAQKQQMEEKLIKVNEAIELCQTSVTRTKEELRGLQEKCQHLRHHWEAQQQQQLQENSVQQKQVGHLKDTLNRQKERLDFLRQQSKVEIKQHSDTGDVTLELLNDKTDQDDAPRMFLSVNVMQDNLGYKHLKSAKIQAGDCNVHAEDLISEGVSNNDLPQLVNTTQDRWNNLFPLVHEMKNMSDRHAIDWIQDQNLLRILLGKNGSIMCTLHVPKSYPFSGEITLQKTSGLSSEDSEKDLMPPVGQRSLQGWVDYLEEQLGKL